MEDSKEDHFFWQADIEMYKLFPIYLTVINFFNSLE